MLREAGIETAQVVRAVAVPSILYSVETTGISDTALNTARSVVSVAGNANTGGRQPDLALAISDGANRTLDPAFEAHAKPIKYWALAHWEEWIPLERLTKMKNNAIAKLETATRSVWSKVTGPTTALIATLKRIRWKWASDTVVIDDIGRSWDFVLDPPSVLAAAARASVRRWRLSRIIKLFPQLSPSNPDVRT